MSNTPKDNDQPTYAALFAEVDALTLATRLQNIANDEFSARPVHAAILREAARRINQPAKVAAPVACEVEHRI